MRTIKTYILRLLVDTDEPQVLRGTVRAVAGDDEHPFADGPSLLTLLRQISRLESEGTRRVVVLGKRGYQQDQPGPDELDGGDPTLTSPRGEGKPRRQRETLREE